MPDPNKPVDNKILVDAVTEMKAMARDGTDHPSTKPVVIAGVAGAVIGAILFDDVWLLTLLGGAAAMLYKRIRP